MKRLTRSAWNLPFRTPKQEDPPKSHVLEAALAKLEWNATHDEQVILTRAQTKALWWYVHGLVDRVHERPHMRKSAPH